MRTARRQGVVAHILALSWRADPLAVATILVLVVAKGSALALTGLGQRWLVDEAGLGSARGVLIAAVIGAVARTVNATGVRVLTNLETDLGERVDLLLKDEVLGDCVRVPTVEHLERADHLDRLTLLRNGTKTVAGLCWAIAETGMAMVGVVLSVWLLGTVHPLLTVLAVLALPPLLTTRRVGGLMRRASLVTAEATRLEERLHGMCLDPESAKEIYASGTGGVLSGVAAGAWRATARTMARAKRVAAGYQLAGWSVYAIGYVAALAFVATLVGRGDASLGDLILVMTISTGLRAQIRVAVEYLGRVHEAGHVTDNYLWLRAFAADRLAETGTAGLSLTRLTTGIELRDVSFTYYGADHPVLKGVSIILPAGSTVAIVGVNGAGKTTLVKLLTGMIRPSGGGILVDGHPLDQIDLASWRGRSSGVFQDFTKFAVPLRETVGLGDLSHIDDVSRVTRAVTGAGADDVVARLHDGLETQLGRVYDGVELSQGQWQRLALARGLMRQRALLLVLDEPTAALDPHAEHELFRRFADSTRDGVSRGRITILVSHRFSTVQLADHIIVLAGGRVVEQGSHEQLMAGGGQYAQQYAAQSAGYR